MTQSPWYIKGAADLKTLEKLNEKASFIEEINRLTGIGRSQPIAKYSHDDESLWICFAANQLCYSKLN